MPFDTGARPGPVAAAHEVGVGHDREHHAVVMAVIRALDLADDVPAGGRPGHADRVHRGLGARVGEPEHLEVEPPADLLAEGDGRLGGDREVGAPARRLVDGLDDPRMGVADHHRAEPAVEVEILGAVLVPDVAAAARGSRRSGRAASSGTTTRRRTASVRAARSYSSADRGVRASNRVISAWPMSWARPSSRSLTARSPAARVVVMGITSCSVEESGMLSPRRGRSMSAALEVAPPDGGCQLPRRVHIGHDANRRHLRHDRFSVRRPAGRPRPTIPSSPSSTSSSASASYVAVEEARFRHRAAASSSRCSAPPAAARRRRCG